MHVTQFIGYVQTNFNNAMNGAVEVIRKPWDDDIWPHTVEPLVKRYIKPLRPIDFIYLTASAVGAVALVVIVPLIFGKAFIPFAGVGSTLLIIGAFTWAGHRLRKHFNNEAVSNHIEPVLEEIRNTTVETRQNTLRLITFRDLYNKNYDHLKEDLKKVEEQFEVYRKATFAPDYKISKNKILADLEDFIRLPSAGADHVRLFDEMRAEIDKVGTEQQNLGEIEKKWLAVRKLLFDASGETVRNLYSNFKDLNEAFKKPHYKGLKDKVLADLEDFKNLVSGNADQVRIFEEMRVEIDKAGTEQQNLGEIEKKWLAIKNLLNNPNSHSMQNLYSNLQNLYEACEGPNCKISKDKLLADLENFKLLTAANVEHVGIFEALRVEIDKAGTEQQNFGEIEKKWLAVTNLINNVSGDSMRNLFDNLKDLYKACEGPNFENSKEVFLKEVETFRNKVISQ